MLPPDDRQQLMEALRPPQGYTLDRAVGTTFSLDLLALLTVPMAFTFFQMEEDDLPDGDPLLMLEALRQYAARIAIFCQAGQIAVPTQERRNLLFSYLEDSIFEVKARSQHGVFHPKVWAMRYCAKDQARPVRYRLLCLSRNLTFDRAWDTVLTLEGELTERVYAYGDQHPLGDFFATLPDLAVRQVTEEAKATIQIIEKELRKVQFQLPRHVEKITFLPLGLKRGEQWVFDGPADRVLVVSPFLSGPFVRRITSGSPETMLVSRLD